MNTKNLAPGIAIVMVLMLATAAALLATPVLAAPPGEKYVASLEDDTERCGQVIFSPNNPEDDGTYELEVEVEECMALACLVAGETVNHDVSINDVVVCTIDIDEYGDGKVTCYVAFFGPGATVTVGDEDELTRGEWRFWSQGKGKK